MAHLKFDAAKLEKLNDPKRLEYLDPDILWRAMDAPVDAREIVEIGAGTGMFAVQFLGRATQAVLHATDIEPPMISWMQANRPEVAQGRLVPVRSHETRVPLDDSCADVVYMINLHHELADPSAIYAEARRLLRSGGVVLVADWAPVETLAGPPQHVRVGAETIARMLEDVGFERVRVHGEMLPMHSLVTGTRP